MNLLGKIIGKVVSIKYTLKLLGSWACVTGQLLYMLRLNIECPP